MGGPQAQVDYFISYTSADRAWAEWIAWQLKQAGSSVVLQAWDMIPGRDFVHEMQKATTTAKRTIAVLSPAYLTSQFGEAEWGIAFASDPRGKKGRLVPVRVADFAPEGLLATRIYIDLVAKDRQAARTALLEGLEGQEIAIPTEEPRFPGKEPTALETFEPGQQEPRFPSRILSGAAIQVLQHHRDVNVVAFSPDGRLLATGSDDYMAQVWEVASGRELSRITHHDWVRGVAFSPDGRLLATGSNLGTAQVWWVASQQKLTEVTHEPAEVWGVAFSPDGRLLATASADGTARVWEVASGQERTRVAHESIVRGVAFSPDGRLLATASDDGTARVWEVASGQERTKVTHDPKVWGGCVQSGWSAVGHRQRRWDRAGVGGGQWAGAP
jgi:hypothetical protein